MFAILNWADAIEFSDLAIVTEENGTPLLFDKLEVATRYARLELNFHWTIVDLF